MKRAIRVHRRDFIAIVSLVALAVAVVAYVLAHQPAFTFGQSYYTVYAQFQSANGVTAGQGQTVDIAGVEVGQVGGVRVQDGRAVVTMDIFKRYSPIYRNASVLLRPRTPLKDMYLSLDRGTPQAGRIPNGGTLPVGATQPDIDVDQILSSLDADTREYLLLLLSGGAQVFRHGAGTGGGVDPAAVNSLRRVFKRFAPLDRDTMSLTGLLAERQRNIHRAIHNLDLVAGSVGEVDTSLTSLIRASDTDFSAIASQDAGLERGLTLLPGTLEQTTRTLRSVHAFASHTAPALRTLEPMARELGPALRASQPLFRDTTPVIREQLRPFARAVQPVAALLEPAAARLSKATPHLVSSLRVLNTLFNVLAHQPGKGARSYLFWGSWLAHIANSLTNDQDAEGPVVRGVFVASCPELDLFETALVQSDPALKPLIDLLNPPNYADIKSSFCPAVLP